MIEYWNAMKKEFNLSSFTAAIDEMLNDVIFFTLDDLSEQFNNKAIRLVQKVSSKLQGLLNDKKIDENTLQTALKKYRYSFILIINLWVAPKIKKDESDLRDYLITKYQFNAQHDNDHILWKLIEASK